MDDELIIFFLKKKFIFLSWNEKIEKIQKKKEKEKPFLAVEYANDINDKG